MTGLIRICQYALYLPVLWVWLLCVAIPAEAADALPGEDYCDRPVASISFKGNKVTRPQVMMRELVQQVGQPCSLDDIIDGIQNIMDLGLFKSVHAELHLIEEQLDLRYVVDEKFYILPIPRFSRTSDGELRVGMQLRWENFLGRQQQLKLTSEKRQEDDGRGRTGYVHSLRYRVPRFLGGKHGLLIGASVERRNVELTQNDVVFGESLRKSSLFEAELARWVNHSDSVRGLRYYGGFRVVDRTYQLNAGTAGPFTDGVDLSFVMGIENQLIRQDSYRRRGLNYGMSLRFADTVLGSDFDYKRLDLWSAWYIPLRNPQKNLNLQLRVGLSDAAPFGEHSYAIGGGELLRGVESSRDTGNVLTLLNMEYLSGFYAYPAWRWVAFADIGNVFARKGFDMFNQNLRAGLGLRYKIESFTNTDLRIDVAWDPDQDKLTPYVSTSLTF